MRAHIKAALAATAGAGLLLGAGTLASWNDSEDIGGGPIDSGTLSLSEERGQGCDSWELQGASTYEPGVTRVVPGDVITRTCTYTVNASGANLAATAGLVVPEFTEDNALVDALDREASYTLGPVDGTPVAMTNGDPIDSGDDGHVLTATMSVTFDVDTSDAGAQDLTATLENVAVSLTQTLD